MLCVLAALAAATAVAAPPLADEAASGDADELRLFERQPHDLIVLADEARSVVEIVPLVLPARQLPPNPQPHEKLIVYRLADPQQPYEVAWRDLAEVKLFEQMVLDEANRLVVGGSFDEAYDYFEYLQREHPKWPGVADSLQAYLKAEAADWLLRRRFDNALALLDELYELNPQREGLSEALGQAVRGLIGQRVEAEDYDSAYQLLGQLADKFPQHAAVIETRREFSARAADVLSQAQAHFDAGRWREAQQDSLRALALWPNLPTARQLVVDTYQKYPRVVVGVTQSVSTASPRADDREFFARRFFDWAARRTERLLRGRWIELRAVAAEGGTYTCSLGSIEHDDFERRLLVRIDPARHPAAPTGYDLARQLAAMADPLKQDYRSRWAGIFGGLEVHDVFQVTINLSRPHVRPDALLAVLAQQPRGPGDAWTQAIRPAYRVAQQSSEAVHLVATAATAATTQPQEIVERRFPDVQSALAALNRGEIHLVDRVNPWDLAQLGRSDDLVVQPYAVPTVHCLLPNPNRPFTARRAFRRALVYGINRGQILGRLLQGTARPGCQLVSGPFAAGTSLDDPIRYAYDASIEPRPYDPRLAMTLANLALREVSAEAREGEVDEIPVLVLAHPPNDVARSACQAIAQHLQGVDIRVTLRQWEAGTEPRPGGDDDLVYAELMLAEPLVEAACLLGPGGILGGCSPYTQLALRQLDAAGDWNEVRTRLHQVHRLAHDEAAVIPLWQLTEHLVYHRSVGGIGRQPVSLYADLAQWQVAPRLPPEVP